MNTSETKNKVKIEELFDKLRAKLGSFEVINIKGEKVGRIKDFTLDKNRRLYMVVPQLPQGDSPVFLLSSKYIDHVDSANRTVFVNINQEDWKNLPLYQQSNQNEFSQPSNQQEVAIFSDHTAQESLTNTSEAAVDTGEVIRLIEERLVINRSQYKIGEVIVRKQIETRYIEVPVKREKLIVENINAKNQQPIGSERISPEDIGGEQTSASLSNSPVADSEKTNLQKPVLDAEIDQATVVEEEIVRLLEERLVINRKKWKVGEVVIRKEIETETIQVPIRRETLIVEQVGSPNNKILAEIDLAKGEVTEMAKASGLQSAVSHNTRAQTPLAQSATSDNTVIGEFLSPKAAGNLLDAIALQGNHGCTKIRIELVVEDSELQSTYQNMFDRCSTQ